MYPLCVSRAQEHSGGLVGNKQKLTSARHGVLKDASRSLDTKCENLMVEVKERGGRAVKK